MDTGDWEGTYIDVGGVASDFIVKSPIIPGQGGGLVGACHRISSPRGGGLVTMTVTNLHLAPPMPVWGVVGHNIDRCIT